MTPYLIDAAAARREASQLAFVEVAPWRVMADGPDPVDGSIPGAVTTSIKDDFAGTPTLTGGHLPLPDPMQLVAALESRGIRPTDAVVVYTRRIEELSSATRAWFTLTWAGFPSVRVLDGGLPAWVGIGGPTEAPRGGQPTCPPRVAELPLAGDTATPVRAGVLPESLRRSEPSASVLDPLSVRVLDAADVLEISEYGTLLDARPAATYNGVTGDLRSGHIPHAVHAPSSELVTADGRLLSATDLRKWFLRRRAVGSQQVGAYCGGGVSSSLLVFAAALLDQPIGLYVDSWSAWSTDTTLPVEQGPNPSHSPLLDTDCT